MKIENEIGELILDISDNPETLDARFDELVNLIKNSNANDSLTTILNDTELTDIINKLSKGDDSSKLKNYLSDSFKAIRKSFADVVNFSECSLGLVVNDPPVSEMDKVGTVMYDSESRKIVVAHNFGYIIDKVGSSYQVKKHSIAGDIYNFSNWKLISKYTVSGSDLPNIVK